MDPLEEATIISTLKDMERRVGDLERNQKITAAVDGRRDSLEIGTPGKGGNFKHYNDPSVSATENDHLLAERARTFMNSGGELPENFSPRIKAMAEEIERQQANGGA